jgi:RNase H-fold protein (predicted Holliday junction resolvase)
MKKFLLMIVSFLLIAFILFLLILGIYSYRINNIKFKDSVNTIICGDSHTQAAINDSILKRSVNLSVAAQPYFYTYNVIKHTLKNNPQIKTVILGCSFHSFSTQYDKYIYDKSENKGPYLQYFPILDKESKKKVFYNNPKWLVILQKDMCIDVVKAVFHNCKEYNDFPFYGFFYKSNKSNITTSNLNEAIVRHYYQTNGSLQEFSKDQKHYFDDIVNVCKRNGVKLILVNTPLTKSYTQKIPSVFITDYYEIQKRYKNEVQLLDFHSLPLDRKYYGDADHVNAYGAEILTRKIDSIVNKN